MTDTTAARLNRHASGPTDAIPPAAGALGIAGVVPFLAAAVGTWWLPAATAVEAGFVQAAYGAVILSFLGGVHWGVAMGAERRGLDEARVARWFAWSTLPSLLGWIAVLLPSVIGLLLLIAGFAAQYAGDRAAVGIGFGPAWFLRLRRRLSILVVVCLAVGAAALITRSGI